VIIVDYRSHTFVEIADTYCAGGFKGITMSVFNRQRSTTRVSYCGSPYLIALDYCFMLQERVVG
jgi:hypothetical protein